MQFCELKITFDRLVYYGVLQIQILKGTSVCSDLVCCVKHTVLVCMDFCFYVHLSCLFSLLSPLPARWAPRAPLKVARPVGLPSRVTPHPRLGLDGCLCFFVIQIYAFDFCLIISFFVFKDIGFAIIDVFRNNVLLSCYFLVPFPFKSF